MKLITIENILCKIGNNSKENWALLDNVQNQNFWFFHLTSFPSCYVIAEQEIIDNETIKAIAILCKQHTKYKNLKHVKVDYCICNNVEKGELSGEIIYKSNRKIKTIVV